MVLTLTSVADLLMMADDFINDEAQEFLGEIRIKLGVTCQLPKPLYLPLFTCGVCGDKTHSHPSVGYFITRTHKNK